MSQGKKLFIFTASFPYGIAEHWKSEEIYALSGCFSEITIIPHAAPLGKENYWVPPANCRVTAPLFSGSIFIKPGMIVHLFSRRFLTHVADFFTGRVYQSKKRIIAWIDSIYRVQKMLKHETVKQIARQQKKEEITLYFYWAMGSSLIVPFLKGFSKEIVRFHGFDLYEERNDGYLPLRKNLLQHISQAVFISEQGKEYLENKYPFIRNKSRVFRIGTVDKGDALEGTDGKLHLVSCSSVIPLKRVSLILEALKTLTIPVEWTHIGGGELFDELKSAAASAQPNLKINFCGQLKSDEVLQYYINKPFDLFVNVSTTEGVPVSVMEAFSASIPVYATNVGGTAEIVDDSVGRLMPAEITAGQLGNLLTGFSTCTQEEKAVYRKNAKQRFRDKCNAVILNRRFAEFLSQC